MKDVISRYRLWRKRNGRCFQILGKKDIQKPSKTPLKMPTARLNQLQRQVVLNWYWGADSDFRRPINTIAAVSEQLRVSGANYIIYVVLGSDCCLSYR